MARRRGYSRASSGSRRVTDWGDGPGGVAATAISASSVAILGSGIVPVSAQKLTLVRTRGLLSLVGLTSTSGGDGFQGAFGIGKIALTAFTAGVGSVPTPVTEVDWDGWLFWYPISLHRGDNAFANGSFAQQVVVDSKAMRKFDAEEVLYASLEVTEIGGVTMSVFFDSRMLFMLS